MSLYEKVSKKLVSIFHIPKHDVMRWDITSNFQIVEDEYRKGLIYQDSNNVFTSDLYFTPDPPLENGTALFRNNANYDGEHYEEIIKENDEHFRRKEPVDFSYHSIFDEVVRATNQTFLKKSHV